MEETKMNSFRDLCFLADTLGCKIKHMFEFEGLVFEYEDTEDDMMGPRLAKLKKQIKEQDIDQLVDILAEKMGVNVPVEDLT